MGEQSSSPGLRQLVWVFVAAVLLIALFDGLRADLATMSLQAETVLLLLGLVVVGVGYWYSAQ